MPLSSSSPKNTIILLCMLCFHSSPHPPCTPFLSACAALSAPLWFERHPGLHPAFTPACDPNQETLRGWVHPSVARPNRWPEV
ncbi:hypothetical protein M3J09_006817 [Ascochyta lentis]